MKRLVLFLALLLMAAPARADVYKQPTWDSLIKTLVRYGALELNDDKVLDEYAMVTDCDLYHAFFQQDFKWQQVRSAMRQSVAQNRGHFPSGYVYQDKVALGRYDFKEQMYHFSENNLLQKVNAFFLLRTNGKACDTTTNFLPHAFRAVLDESVSLPGLPLTQRSADDLLRRMDANKNKDRLIYVRFNLHVNFVGKLGPNPNVEGGQTTLVQQGAKGDAPVLLNAQVDTIDFYEDEGYTKRLYSFQP